MSCLLSLLEFWATGFALTRFKHVWKMAILLALATEKYCSDLTSLCTNYWQLFLQCHTAIFVPAYDGNMDQLSHLPPQMYTESHSNVDLCPEFNL